MKSTTINLRVDQITKDKLENLSESKNVNISGIIRDVLNEFLDNEIYLDPKITEAKYGLHLIKTVGFTEFIFWLYHKTMDSEITEIDELYIQFIKIISECKMYPIFNSELIVEFDKVSSELNRVLYDQNYNEANFQFPYSDENPFDYQVLADFMFTFRYDLINNEIIHCK
jgi:hypothetical protein